MIRLSELRYLQLSDIDLKSGMIKVYGKGRKERFIPLGAKTIKAIHHYLIKFRNQIPGTYLICKSDGSPFEQRSVQQIIERIRNKSGISGLSAHRIRHSGATFWVKQGGPVAILQKILGHTSPAVTNIYVNLAGVDIKEWHNRFSPADRLKN